MGRHKHEKLAGDDDGDTDAPHHWWTAPPFDPSQNWRFNHHIAFLALGIAAPTLDLALVAFMCFEHFDMDSTVWVTTAVFVTLEALYIAASVACITLKKFTTSKLDLGWPLSLFWALSLGASICFFLGAFKASTTDDQAFLYGGIALAAISNIATIVLSIVSYMRHILYLEDPRDPEESGSAHKHHHHFRRHKKQKHADDTDEDA